MPWSSLELRSTVRIASEVPGPGAYNPQGENPYCTLCCDAEIALDPEYDTYKRGAFLEKTNRFNKDKPDDIPGRLTQVMFAGETI